MLEQKRLRIRLTLFAYAYEFKQDSLISDNEYDRMAKLVDTTIDTGNIVYDNFFKQEYMDYSGMWIRKHPDVFNGKLESLYNRIKAADIR